jgi:hypothetical protein
MEKHEEDRPPRVALATMALSVFCLATVGVFVPTMLNRLDSAHQDIEQRMMAFKVRFFPEQDILLSGANLSARKLKLN